MEADFVGAVLDGTEFGGFVTKGSGLLLLKQFFPDGEKPLLSSWPIAVQAVQCHKRNTEPNAITVHAGFERNNSSILSSVLIPL